MAKPAKEKDNESEGPVRHRKIGPYRVLNKIGRGGMAQVYRAVHEGLQREVAIKELLPNEVKDKESQSRFHREALALAAFRHQNIVTLYDLIEKNDALFMVMEYVDGPTLADVLRGGALPPPVAAVIACRVASALDHAHFNRIVHRDIKPANVMITKAGEVKLMDFGIAKDEGLAALTRQGMAVGTPTYMSPEQVTGQPVDFRTDLFSLGVVLYEMLTGLKPFTGQSAGEVFAKIRDGSYSPVDKVVPGVGGRLARMVRRALRTSPDRRYQDAAELRRELEVYLARQVTISHQALLVAFLKYRKHLTETEVRARLNERELTLADSFDKLKFGQRRLLTWYFALAAALGAAGLFFLAQAYGWVPFLR